MSIEYTIDIQLTELGFPEIHAPPEAELKRDLEDDSEVYNEDEVDDEEDLEDEEALHNELSHSSDHCCSVCDLQLPSKFKLKDHMNLHTGARPYCCAECGKRFCQIYNYRVHLRTHAQIKVNPLMCRICRIGFSSQEALKDHLSHSHFENEFYECDLCKRVFTSLKTCEHHVQEHKCMLNLKCEICSCNFTSVESLTRHRKRMCHRKFKCTDCTKTFAKKNALLKHSFSHLGLLPYTCIRCRCHFRLAKLYRQHKCQPQLIHCVACLREFLSQKDFQQHKKDTGCWGNQERKANEIRCLECGQKFDTSEELKKHAGAHQRVLKCAECGKGFRSALLLMSHMGGHAGNSPCLCQSCGLGFPHQQNYDSHLKKCGQIPQCLNVPKKHQSSTKTSLAKKAKLEAIPDLTSTRNTCSVPGAPGIAHSSPGLGTEGVSAGYVSPDGLWKLTLDRQPPPGAKLLLFLPVCPNQSNGLTLPLTLPQRLPGPALQVQPHHLGMNAALGSLLNVPLNLATGIKRDPECESPLDLSKKCDTLKSALSDIIIKSEPEELRISGKAHATKRQELKNDDNKTIVEPNPGEFQMNPRAEVKTNANAHITDIKKEPLSHGYNINSWSHPSDKKKIKMEADEEQIFSMRTK